MRPSRPPSSRKFATQLLNALRAHPRASDNTDAAHAASVNDPFVNAAQPTRKQLVALHVLFPNELIPALDLLDRRLVARFRIRRAIDQTPLTQSISSLHGHGPNADHAIAQSDDGPRGDAAEGAESVAALTHTAGEVPSADVEMTDAEAMAPLPNTVEHPEGIQPQSGTTRQSPVHSKTDTDTIFYVRSAQYRPSRFTTSQDTTTAYQVRLTAWNCSCPAFAFSAFPAVHPEPPVPVHDDPSAPASVELNSVPAAASEDGWVFGGLSLGDGPTPVCKHLLACVLVERCPELFGGFVEERWVGVEEAAGWAAGWTD